MQGRLAGKRALVTGAANGIGQAIAEAFDSQGAAVAMIDVDGERLDAVGRRLDNEAAPIICDVSDPESCRNAVGEVTDTWGGLDIVVNNAGVITRSELVDATDREIDEMIDVNLKGCLYMTRAAVETLDENEGVLLNLSSVVSELGLPGRSVYTSTKGGIKSLTQQLAVELAPSIRVNAIAPGSINTDLGEKTKDTSERAAERKKERIPLGRFGTPEEVATTVTFLASPEASYVTGHVLFVDGGWSIS